MPGPLRILGVDPGTRVLGYGLVDLGGVATGAGPGWRDVECGGIKAPVGREMPARLAAIALELTVVIDELSPAAVAIEKAFFGKSVGSALKLGQVRGAVMLLAGQHGLPVFEYGPTVIKRAVAGHGRATKFDVQQRVQMLLGLRRTPTEDAADALAIAMCHANYVSFPGPGAPS
jgi:crossover junction endodeoxyribonuclease RuvC